MRAASGTVLPGGGRVAGWGRQLAPRGVHRRDEGQRQPSLRRRCTTNTLHKFFFFFLGGGLPSNLEGKIHIEKLRNSGASPHATAGTTMSHIFLVLCLGQEAPGDPRQAGSRVFKDCSRLHRALVKQLSSARMQATSIRNAALFAANLRHAFAVRICARPPAAVRTLAGEG